MLIELLTSSTGSVIVKFLIDKIDAYKKSMGTNKEIELLKEELEIYKEKTWFAEKELVRFKEMTKKLETKLGSNYVSEDNYVNWNFNTIKSKMSTFKIEIWTDKGDFHVVKDNTIIPKMGNYRIGDKINIYFSSEKDCYLTIINEKTGIKIQRILKN
jgi:cell shape-determining protein MreC